MYLYVLICMPNIYGDIVLVYFFQRINSLEIYFTLFHSI